MKLGDKQILSIRQSANARVSIWEGSVRSGKTIASLLRLLMTLATLDTQGEIVVISRTRDSAARNVFAPLQNADLFGPEIATTTHYSVGAPSGMILGRKVWVLGSSDRRAENVLRGLTCALAYVDEITLLQEDFFTQLLNRLWIGAQLFGTTNPDNPRHWFKVKFLDRVTSGELPDWRTWKFKLDDNPELDPATKERIKRENTGLYYQRNVEGIWAAAEGAIYPDFDPERHVVPKGKMPIMDQVLTVGVDYGTDHPTRAYLLGIGEVTVARGGGHPVWGDTVAGGESITHPALFVLSEFAPKSATVGEHAIQFADWLSGQPKPRHGEADWSQPRWIAVDPSSAVFKLQLRRDGMLHIMNAHNRVLKGIQTVSSLLASGGLYVSADCPELITGIPNYGWDKKATDRGSTEPLKVDDDEVDALRYAVYTSRQHWQKSVPLGRAVSSGDNME